VGSEPDSVVAADVNGDGKLDLISANYNANTLTVLTNNGSGGFVISSSPAWQRTCFRRGGRCERGWQAGLVCANYNDGTLTVLTNNGSGGFVISSSPGVASRQCPSWRRM